MDKHIVPGSDHMPDEGCFSLQLAMYENEMMLNHWALVSNDPRAKTGLIMEAYNAGVIFRLHEVKSSDLDTSGCMELILIDDFPLEDRDMVENVLRGVEMQNEKHGWSCQDWVIDALKHLASEEILVGVWENTLEHLEGVYGHDYKPRNWVRGQGFRFDDSDEEENGDHDEGEASGNDKDNDDDDEEDKDEDGHGDEDQEDEEGDEEEDNKEDEEEYEEDDVENDKDYEPDEEDDEAGED